MKKRKTWKHCLILLLIILTAGTLLQPLNAAENRCGIWCPGCGKWQESFKSEVKGAKANVEIIVSCAECERTLIRVKRWVETATYNVGTDEESSSWWRHYEVLRADPAVVFPSAEAYLEGDSDSDEDSYRVVADDDVFGAIGYGWTTQETFEEAERYLNSLHAGLYNCVKASEDGAFTWKDWYQSGLSIMQTGEKSSPLIDYMSKFGLQAVLQEEMAAPVLSVSGDAAVKVIRNGTMVTGDIKAGDRVEITPVKKAGREYADYALTGEVSDTAWDNTAQKLCFTMPAGDVSVEIYFREVQRLEVQLNAAFYEAYQKEPYWDGVSFNLDCEPPITVEKHMLTVKAVLFHTGSGKEETRPQTEFTIEGDNRIANLGENTILVKADVLGDGYELQGKCVLKADSVSLKELMESTGSQTYTELEAFVAGLTDRLSECEGIIEELSQNLSFSEEQRAEAEQKLSEALAELEDVKARLELSREQLAAMSAELERKTEELEAASAELEKKTEELEAASAELEKKTEELAAVSAELEKKTEELAAKSEELAVTKEQLVTAEEHFAAASEELTGMKEKLTAMQQFMKELVGTEQIDEESLGKLAELFEELKEQKKALSDELEKVRRESGKLTSQNEALNTENEELLRENEHLKSSNAKLAEQLKYTIEEQKVLLREYQAMQEKYDALAGEKEGKEQEYLQKLRQLEGEIEKLEGEKRGLTARLSEKEAEKQKLSDEWELEKMRLAASLEAERERAARLETEANAKSGADTEKEGMTAHTKEPSGDVEQGTVIRLETVTEPENITERVPSQIESGIAADTGLTTESGITADTGLTTESEIAAGTGAAASETVTEPETTTQQEGKEAKQQGFGTGAGKKILPGIGIVILSMLLGGAVLYVALEKKEEEEKEEKVLI